MPLISIITAAHAPSATYLSETAKAIEAVKLPEGWDLEWVVQEDGADPKLREFFAPIPYAKYDAAGRQLGIALTRNLALTRASGVLLQALDQDDMLLPEVFTTLIPHFAERGVHWAIGQADDILPDGTRKPYPSPIPFGLKRPGEVNEFAEADGGNWPIHGAALMLRTATFRALGGWTGIPYDDELATFAALSQICEGYYDEAITWLYRHHPGQTHRTEGAQQLSAAGRRIALQRAVAAQATGMTFSPESAGAFVNERPVQVGKVTKDTTLGE
ncbi:glycosyltransferase family A protein [Actinomadura rupiterrae]|uniref:glycosyltransferase family A protein n=1 Tax=Actinomadura rupiterrae TaxID=559627 RepID=UPI0020A37275|nr:glycosyltransferase family A protein [Actinomadura rupiterrae]MCP2340472.1 glycosyltransferase involved in cell wall biosynthesis [Actinomadura rupiterrae]